MLDTNYPNQLLQQHVSFFQLCRIQQDNQALPAVQVMFSEVFGDAGVDYISHLVREYLELRQQELENPTGTFRSRDSTVQV